MYISFFASSIRKGIFQSFHFLKINIIFYQHIFTDITWDAKLLRRNQYESYIRITYKSFNQRMNSTSEFKVSAQTDGDIIQTSLQGTDSEKIG